MDKPESNAPVTMQPWVRTTDKQLSDLESAVAKLQAATNGATSIDRDQNQALSDAFTFAQQDDGSQVTYSTGMQFTGDVSSTSNIEVAGAVIVGNPSRQEYDPLTGEAINAIPNFEMNAGTTGTNPVTGLQEYYPGSLHMNDTQLDLNVAGIINGDGLSIALTNNAQTARDNIAISAVTGDGTYATYTIPKTDANVANYVAGAYVDIVGIDPTGYNATNVIIRSVNTASDPMTFSIENPTTATYVAGGYVTVSSTNSLYEGRLSVQGPGPDYLGVTLNQGGLYLGANGGDPATAIASITKDAISATQLAGSYMTLGGTNVHVSTTEPSSPANGAIWIDPTKSPVSNSFAYRTASESFASAAARDLAIPSPTAGMVVYLADSNTLTMRIGSAWYPIAGQMPYFETTKTANQTGIVSGNITTVTWPTATYNRGGFTVASNQVTVPVTGMYTINAAITWDTTITAGNNRHILIYVNNVALTREGVPGGMTVDATLRSVLRAYLTAGDVIDVRAYQSSGSNMSITSTRSRLTISYDGP